MIVGWQIASHLRTELVLDALEMAIWRRDAGGGTLIHHSDAGCQYTSFRYSDRLTEAGSAASIGSIGDSYDNTSRGGQMRGATLMSGGAAILRRPLDRRHSWDSPSAVVLSSGSSPCGVPVSSASLPASAREFLG